MSRTYRKPGPWAGKNKESMIKRDLDRFENGYWWRKPTKDTAQIIAEAERYWAKLHWDGTCAETTANQFYKELAGGAIRRANKKLCRDVMLDKDIENIAYPINKIGKTFVWSVW